VGQAPEAFELPVPLLDAGAHAGRVYRPAPAP
jgi:hypothetical protein